MFNINHVAISVTDISKSIEFYKKFGFKEFKSWCSEDGSIKIPKALQPYMGGKTKISVK